MAVMNLSILLTLIACAHGIQNNGTSIRERIPEMLRILCPGNDVCRTNGSDVIADKFSCCFECSCESSCTDIGNCCFPGDYSNKTNNVTFKENVQFKQTSIRKKQRNNQHDERLRVNGAGPQFECMYVSSKQPSSAKDKIRLQSFLMISSGKLYPESSEAKTCGQVRVAPWGNLLPITSKRTGRIYKNPVCADENNVTSGVLWKVVHICKLYDEKTNVNIDTTTFLLGLENEHFPEYCHAEFVPPHDMPTRRQDLCFNDLIDTCTDDDFEIPAGLMSPRDSIVDACTGGLISPFRSNDMYANVFCFICNGNKYEGDMKCQTDGKASFDIPSMTALLEYDFVKDLTFGKKLKMQNNLNKQMACKANTTGQNYVKDRCKPLLCPSGQLRDTEGDCIFPTNSWININIFMHIKLVSDQPLLLNEYIPKTGNRRLDIISKLITPWRRPWKISKIYYVYKDLNSVETNELLVYLINTSPVINAKQLLHNIKRTLKKTWELNLNGTKCKLRQKFWEFLGLHPLALPRALKNYSKENYGFLYENVFMPRNPVSITKLSICEQIQLEVEEFSLIADKFALFNRISGQHLGNSEFTLLPVGSKFLARVCLEDSGFKKVTSHGTSSCAMRCFLLLLLVLIRSNNLIGKILF